MLKRPCFKNRFNQILLVFSLLTFFFISVLGLHAKSTAVQQTTKSCLWSIQTQSNKFYLLGALHVLKQDAYPLAIAKGDYIFLEYLNHWLTLQKTSGAVAKQFDYWILGKTARRKTPRWSIIRNVLHWVD